MQRNLVFHDLRRSKSYNSRVGTRKEGQPDNDPNDFRLVTQGDMTQGDRPSVRSSERSTQDNLGISRKTASPMDTVQGG